MGKHIMDRFRCFTFCQISYFIFVLFLILLDFDLLPRDSACLFLKYTLSALDLMKIKSLTRIMLRPLRMNLFLPLTFLLSYPLEESCD